MTSLIPDDVRVWCHLCPYETAGVEAIAAHMAEVHGLHVQRWPDGDLVVDASDVPELADA